MAGTVNIEPIASEPIRFAASKKKTPQEKAMSRAAFGLSTDGFASGDLEGYKAAQADWMRGSAAFDGWTDEDISGFQDWLSGGKYSDKQKTAAQLWQSNLIGRRNANEQARQDREDILADIEAYKNSFSDEAITAAVAQEQQAWSQKIAETLQSAQQQAAAQGRVLDNATYAMLRGRLEAQAANAIQLVQMQYEQKRSDMALQAIQAKNSVYANSTKTVESAADMTAIIQALAGK